MFVADRYAEFFEGEPGRTAQGDQGLLPGGNFCGDLREFGRQRQGYRLDAMQIAVQ